jgi:hypothetical protein
MWAEARSSKTRHRQSAQRLTHSVRRRCSRPSLQWFCNGRGRLEQAEANDLCFSFIQHDVELRRRNTDDHENECRSREQQNRVQSHDRSPLVGPLKTQVPQGKQSVHLRTRSISWIRLMCFVCIGQELPTSQGQSRAVLPQSVRRGPWSRKICGPEGWRRLVLTCVAGSLQPSGRRVFFGALSPV